MERRKATPPRRDDADGTIPLVDLHPQHDSLHESIMQAVDRVARTQQYVNGGECELFEREMAEYLGVKNAVGMSSGTDALLATLMALGVGEGDEVITTAFSFVATAEVILRLGARPVFVDIRPDDYFIDIDCIRQAMTRRTRAIVVAHLFGGPGPVEQVAELAEARGVVLVEDCAQSLGSLRQGRHVGSFGAAGTLSFFPSKNLGAWGDGGMVVTRDDGLAERLRSIREHGGSGLGTYVRRGGNFRLDTLQAAVLRVKLRHLEDWISQRRRAAELYKRLFRQAGLSPGEDETSHPGHRIVLPPTEAAGDRHTYNLFVVRADMRDELAAFLESCGIQARVYYRTPLPYQPVFSGNGHTRGDFPVAESASDSVLALPMFPGITEAQQRRVVEAVASFYRTDG